MLKVLWRHTCLSLLDNLSYFLPVRRSFSDFAISRRTARFDMWTLLYCPFFFLRSFLFATPSCSCIFVCHQTFYGRLLLRNSMLLFSRLPSTSLLSFIFHYLQPLFRYSRPEIL